MRKKIKILIVVGARPNFIKVAPLIEEIERVNKLTNLYTSLTHLYTYPFKYCLVHTGQHYDFEMSQVFFQDLKIPKPNYNLGVGSGSHAWQTAKVMEKLEPVLLKEKHPQSPIEPAILTWNLKLETRNFIFAPIA